MLTWRQYNVRNQSLEDYLVNMAFGNKKVVEVQASFSERLIGIKSIFSEVYKKAQNLSAEIDTQVELKNYQILKLQEKLEEVNETKKEIETFMKNLEKFI